MEVRLFNFIMNNIYMCTSVGIRSNQYKGQVINQVDYRTGIKGEIQWNKQ